MHPGSLTLAHSLVSYTDRCQSEEFLSHGSGYSPEEDHVDGRPKFKNVSPVTYVTNLQRGEGGGRELSQHQGQGDGAQPKVMPVGLWECTQYLHEN